MAQAGAFQSLTNPSGSPPDVLQRIMETAANAQTDGVISVISNVVATATTKAQFSVKYVPSNGAEYQFNRVCAELIHDKHHQDTVRITWPDTVEEPCLTMTFFVETNEFYVDYFFLRADEKLRTDRSHADCLREKTFVTTNTRVRGAKIGQIGMTLTFVLAAFFKSPVVYLHDGHRDPIRGVKRNCSYYNQFGFKKLKRFKCVATTPDVSRDILELFVRQSMMKQVDSPWDGLSKLPTFPATALSNDADNGTYQIAGNWARRT